MLPTTRLWGNALLRERDALESLERIAATEVGRGSSLLQPYAAGGLEAAAAALAQSPGTSHVGILTGFYLPNARPPTAETDGPLGAAMIGRAVELLGGTATVITDQPCWRVVQAAVAKAQLRGAVLVAPVNSSYGQWESEVIVSLAERPLTHIVSIERVGPNYAGRKLNMRGDDISAYTAPLESLLHSIDAFSIGIGDGGNEIGMGAIDRHVIAGAVTRGDDVACSVPVNALIVAGTSNWGGYALVAALRTWGYKQLDDILLPEWSHGVLNEIVRSGGADGVTLLQRATVDGLTPTHYFDVLDTMREIALDTSSRRG